MNAFSTKVSVTATNLCDTSGNMPTTLGGVTADSSSNPAPMWIVFGP